MRFYGKKCFDKTFSIKTQQGFYGKKFNMD